VVQAVSIGSLSNSLVKTINNECSRHRGELGGYV